MKKVVILSLISTFLIALQAPQLLAARQDNIPGSSSGASLNWAGYEADDGPFTAVTGSWVVPTVNAQGQSGRADATWVGIGGTHSRDLIQAGTQAIVDQGSVTYQAWYETLPDVSIPVSLPVSPGDSITATLNESSPSEWHITVRDNTTGQEFDKTLMYNSSLSSAEWVEERVSDVDGSFWPLDNFGSVTFFNAFATVGGVQKSPSHLGATPITMVNGAGQVLASTSDINARTGAFSVARGDTSSPASVPTYAVVAPGSQFIVISFGPGGFTITQDGMLQKSAYIRHHRYH